MKTKVKENQKGITLIALVITIIVLLILASVSIAMLTGDNGILTRAGDAKIETALGAVKEQIGLYQIEKKMDNKEVTPENLLAEGKVSRTVQAGEADKYYMYYALKENSFEGMQGLGKGNIASLKDVFLIDDNLNIKYISSNGKEYGDSLNNKVLEDETKIRFSSKAFSEYISKISGVAEDEMKFKWMKNQTSLTIADTSVDSLEDLVFFQNLQILSFENLTLDNLDGIEFCKDILTLQIQNCNIIDCSKIRYLNQITLLGINNAKGNINYNMLIDSLKGIETLKILKLNSMNIDSMERIKELNNNIEQLEMGNNKITKIEGLEDKRKLNILILNNNEISELTGLENQQKLQRLWLTGNKISNITPLYKNEELISLKLTNNPDIKPNREEYTEEEKIKLDKIGKILDKKNGEILLDVDKLMLFTNYKRLVLQGQNLTTLEPLEGLTQLEYLDLNYNSITLEDTKSKEILTSMKNLETLCIEGNNIINLTPINELENLKILMMEKANKNGSCNLEQIENIISNLNSFRADQSTIDTLVNCNKEKITRLNFSNLVIQKLPDLTQFKYLEDLRILEVGESKLDKSMISEIKSLKSLTLIKMHGRMIDFSKLINLTNLDLRGNTLWSEDLENLKALKNNPNLTINLSNNSIIDATALLELNSDTKIDLRNNINLSQDSKDKLKAKFGNNVTF